jgi:hypothetical protein
MRSGPGHEGHHGKERNGQQPDQYEKRKKKSTKEMVTYAKQITHQHKCQKQADAGQHAHPPPGPGGNVFLKAKAQRQGHIIRNWEGENRGNFDSTPILAQ